jgi:hypothetical protein
VSIRNTSGISRICQEGRTQFLEDLIDNRLDQLQDLTDRLYRWPIPRPLIMKQRKRALACLTWLSSELRESTACDQQLLDTAEQIVENAVPPIVPVRNAETLSEQQVLDHNAAAEAGVAAIEDR